MKTRILICGFLLAAAAPLFAQQQPATMTLPDALDIAQIENKVPRLELGIVTGDAMPAEEGTVV